MHGEIVVVEWVNGESTIPSFKPIMKLKSTDGKIVTDVFVTPTGTNAYYFDKFIDGLDPTKEYVLEVSSGNPRNVSSNKSMNVKISDRTLGKFSSYTLFVENNKFKFGQDSSSNNYIGNINSELKTFNIGKANNASYVSGEIVVVEWVNGKSTVPSTKPIMRFKSTDGTVNMDVFVTATGTNTYYFDRFIEGIDTSKQYVFEIASGNSKNVSPNKSMNVYFKNQTVGKYNSHLLFLDDNKIKFKLDTYVGNINSELKTFNLSKANSGASYVHGEIVVVEWVNGKSTVPSSKPVMRFKSTDGKVNMDVFVTATGTNTYYFDRFIEGIDTSKQYVFEIISGDSRNTSPNKSMNVYFKNQTIGKYQNYALFLENNRIKFGK